MRLAKEIEKDVKSDIKIAKKIRLGWRGKLTAVVGFLLTILLFDHFGRVDLARPSMLSAGAIAFTAAVKWKLTGQTWFWTAIAVIITLHVVLILSVPWTTKWVPAAACAGICTVDLIAMLAILDALETILQRSAKHRTNSLPY
jgi:hypothetical protein